MSAHNALLAKADIRRSFDRASQRYTSYSQLQQRVSSRLIDILVQNNPTGHLADTLLDLGCGPGVNTQALSKYCRHYIAMDLSASMLSRVPPGNSNTRVQGDMDKLPIADSSVNTVFSSLAVQWSSSPALLLKQLYRIIKPGGSAFISTVLDDSLQPLHDLRLAIDGEHQANRQLTLQGWRELIDNDCRWQAKDIFQLKETVYSEDLLSVLKGVAGVGAGARTGKALTPTTLRTLTKLYEAKRTVAGLPLHYQVGYLQLRKPSIDNFFDDKKS